eukprot:s2252_g2.t1
MVSSHEPSPDQADVVQEQVRQSRKDAKRAEARRALAILEVKDGVIERLEQEVHAAEAEISHYEEGAELAEARAAAASATEATAALIHDDTWRAADAHAESDCQMLAVMAHQAERRAQYAATEVFELGQESKEAEHNIEQLSAEISRLKSPAQPPARPLAAEAALLKSSLFMAC